MPGPITSSMSECRGGSEGKEERITQERNDIKSFNKTTERNDANASRQDKCYVLQDDTKKTKETSEVRKWGEGNRRRAE